MGSNMSKIPFNLNRTGVLTLLIISAFIGSWLFIQKQTKLRQIKPIPITKHKSDGFTSKIVYRDIDKKGQLKNQLTSTQLTHYPKENNAQLMQPTFILHETSRKRKVSTHATSKMPWVITANRAESLEGNKIIKLYGHVSIDKASDENHPDQHFRTKALTFYPKENRLETEHPVTLWQPDTMIQATGLKANLDQDTVIFLANTRMVYKPQKSKDPTASEERRFKTDRLVFHPKTNIAETQDPVVLEQPGTIVHAKGLKADLKRNAVTFLSQTKIIYTPNKTQENPKKSRDDTLYKNDKAL